MSVLPAAPPPQTASAPPEAASAPPEAASAPPEAASAPPEAASAQPEAASATPEVQAPAARPPQPPTAPSVARARSRCEHMRLSFQCIECKGPSICEHARVRTRCRACGGKSICEHNRTRSRCRLCLGGAICQHGRERRVCRACAGSGVCQHRQLRVRCRTCSPVQHAMHCMRSRTAGMLRRAGLVKQHATNKYLGCSGDEFSSHIAAKMDTWNAMPMHADMQMTRDNIEIDHIKPCAAALPSEFEAITHFTNTQPLLKTANRVKSSKWSEADDAFWRANIAWNVAFRDIYWPLACQ